MNILIGMIMRTCDAASENSGRCIFGRSLSEASNGMKCDYLVKSQPDVLLLDINIGAQRFEVLKDVKTDLPAAPSDHGERSV